MNTAVYIVPSLHFEQDSAVSSNCLLNTITWENIDEFFCTYTFLLPKDIPRYLGCRIIHAKAVNEPLTLGTLSLPRPLIELATRDELTAWLTRVFLNIVSPGAPQDRPHNVRLPNTLVGFFALLLHLHRVGFPGHWLSEFLKGVLSGSLITDIDSFRGLWPIPTSELNRRVPARRVRLDPWVPELETIISIADKGIPFSISSTPDHANGILDIGTFEARVKPKHYPPTAIYRLMSPFAPHARLLFYKPGDDSAEDIVSKLPSLVECKGGRASGQVYIVTAPDKVQFDDRVTWKMSKKRVEKMIEEKWNMVVYRTETC